MGVQTHPEKTVFPEILKKEGAEVSPDGRKGFPSEGILVGIEEIVFGPLKFFDPMIKIS
jgi:hypothetical protein